MRFKPFPPAFHTAPRASLHVLPPLQETTRPTKKKGVRKWAYCWPRDYQPPYHTNKHEEMRARERSAAVSQQDAAAKIQAARAGPKQSAGRRARALPWCHAQTPPHTAHTRRGGAMASLAEAPVTHARGPLQPGLGACHVSYTCPHPPTRPPTQALARGNKQRSNEEGVLGPEAAKRLSRARASITPLTPVVTAEVLAKYGGGGSGSGSGGGGGGGVEKRTSGSSASATSRTAKPAATGGSSGATAAPAAPAAQPARAIRRFESFASRNDDAVYHHHHRPAAAGAAAAGRASPPSLQVFSEEDESFGRRSPHHHHHHHHHHQHHHHHHHHHHHQQQQQQQQHHHHHGSRDGDDSDGGGGGGRRHASSPGRTAGGSRSPVASTIDLVAGGPRQHFDSGPDAMRPGSCRRSRPSSSRRAPSPWATGSDRDGSVAGGGVGIGGVGGGAAGGGGCGGGSGGAAGVAGGCVGSHAELNSTTLKAEWLIGSEAPPMSRKMRKQPVGLGGATPRANTLRGRAAGAAGGGRPAAGGADAANLGGEWIGVGCACAHAGRDGTTGTAS